MNWKEKKNAAFAGFCSCWVSKALIVTDGRLSFLALRFFALGLTVFSLLRANMKIKDFFLVQNMTCKRSLKSIVSQITCYPIFKGLQRSAVVWVVK